MPLPLLALLALGAAGTAGAGAAIGAARRAGKTRNPLEERDDAEVVDQFTDGPFLSALDAIGRPGKAINNLLVGNVEGAGRQVVDLFGDVIDAPLPGDWIPHLSRRMDKPEFSDVVGGMEPGVGKFLVDVVGGAATDPVSFIPGAKAASLIGSGVAKAGSAAVGIASKLPAGAKAVATAKDVGAKGARLVRSTFGAQRIRPETRRILDAARAAKFGEAEAGLGAIKGSVLASMPERELAIVGDVIDNRLWQDRKLVRRLGDDSSSALDRVALHPEVTPENAQRIRQAVQDALAIGQSQAQRPGIFAAGELPREYLQRQYTGQTADEVIGEAMGQPSAVKGRTLKTFEDQADYLAKNPGVSYERNAAIRLGKRAEQQGTLAQRAEIGRAIFGKDFAYADPAMRAEVIRRIEAMAPEAPEDARMLLDAFKGLAPRSTVMDWLATGHKFFKRAAVAGAFIPKLGSVNRNKIGAVWQAISNPESRGVAGGQVRRYLSDLYGAFADGLAEIGVRLPKDALGRKLQAIDQAFMASRGSADNAMQLLRQGGHEDLAELVRAGVLDGFVTSEELLTSMARKPWTKALTSAMNWPVRIFRGLEDRMRLGMGLDLVHKQGRTADDAARIVRDSLYDYDVSSAANRTARDVIPFFQFSAKAIPQTAKFMVEKPVVASALEKAYSDDPDAPLYPYLEGKLNIPTGTDEVGNAEYISGLGLPFEALSQVPGSWRDTKRNVVGSMSPPLKTLFGAVSGEDPYFETPFGSYAKMPVAGEAGGLGAAYNAIAGTGLIQPIDSPLRLIDKLLDDRHGAGAKALDLLTGAKVVSVDPDRARQLQLQQALQENPDVRQWRGFYADDGDDTIDAMIRDWRRAKDRVREKREEPALPAMITAP